MNSVSEAMREMHFLITQCYKAYVDLMNSPFKTAASTESLQKNLQKDGFPTIRVRILNAGALGEAALGLWLSRIDAPFGPRLMSTQLLFKRTLPTDTSEYNYAINSFMLRLQRALHVRVHMSWKHRFSVQHTQNERTPPPH